MGSNKNKQREVFKSYFGLSMLVNLNHFYSNKAFNRKARHNLFTAFFAIAIIYFLFFCTHSFARDLPQKTVKLSTITSLDKYPKENKYYTIDDVVRTDDSYYRFLIKSAHGDYNVLSIRDLFKVCHEIRVIEDYRATDEGDEAWNAAGESFKNIGRGVKQIVKEPKESAKALIRNKFIQ